MIARPSPDLHGEILELSAPAFVLGPNSPRTDHEDIDVAGRVAVRSGRRAEQRKVQGRHHPGIDRGDQPPQELRADGRQEFHRRCRHVLAVQRVKECPARLRPVHQTVLDQPVESVKGAGVRRAARESSDLTTGERPGRPSKDSEHITIDAGHHGSVGAGDVHMDIISDIWTQYHPFKGKAGLQLSKRPAA